MEYITTAAIVAFVIIVLSGFTQGFVGFGYSQIVLPVVAFFYEPKLVVPILLMHSVILNMMILWDARKHINMKIVYPLILTAIPGLPVGTYLLLWADANIMKIIIGILIVLSSLMVLYGLKIKIKREKLATLPVGFTSGLLNSSTTMSGPPVILFYSNQGIPKETFRACLAAYFLSLNIITLPFHIWKGLINSKALLFSSVTLPLMMLGVFIGIKVSKKIQDELFQKIALIILIAVGVMSILSGTIMMANK